jgi:hypothetical protein
MQFLKTDFSKTGLSEGIFEYVTKCYVMFSKRNSELTRSAPRKCHPLQTGTMLHALFMWNF